MSEERKHHACSPSSLQFVEACPPFKNHGEIHAAAIVGTLQHTSTETRQDDASLTDDQAAHVAFCIDFIERRRQLMEEERQREVGRLERMPKVMSACFTVPDVLSLSEQFLAIDEIERDFPGIGKESCTTGGYVDQVLISSDRKRAELIDHKFGKWRVTEAATNTQGIAYSLGLFRAYPTLETVTVFFVQPAIEFTTQHTFKRSDIPELYLRIVTIVERRIEALKKADFSMAVPATPTCLFCAQKALCPKLTAFVLRVGKKFSPLDIPESLEISDVLDPKQASIGMKLAQVVGVWADAFKKRTTDRVICDGAEPPTGYGLHKGTGRRSIVDQAKFKAVALSHLTEAELSETASYSLTETEKQISNKAPRGDKAASVDAFRADAVAFGAVKPGEPFVYLKVLDSE